MLPQSEAAELTRRFQERVASIGDRAATVVANLWRTSGHDATDLAGFITRVAPIITATKAASVSVGAGYYSTLLQIRPVAVPAAAVIVPDELREPFIAYWRAINADHPVEEAIRSGVARSEAIARNLAVSSSRRAGDVVTAASNVAVVGWRRVLDGGACQWCAGLTANTYSSAEAADFGHDRCGCTAMPVIE